ncbi:MAG: hypothetical protein A4E55_00313 [Pelotomaculum sp. PtaU1.Bin035]|nr:MAG: hypothetical protein A4E55_00313 [Pelotomaculum sp. PtaU1.Bin035]
MANNGPPFYQSTIEKLLFENRCPPCVYGEESKKTYLKWFDIEYYNSVPTMLEVSKNGFCRQHGWQISSLGNELSTLNQFVANIKLTELKNIKAVLQSNKNGWLGQIWPFSVIFSKRSANVFINILKRLRTAEKCPICETVEQGEQRALTYLASFLKEKKGQKIYRQSPALCWRHLIGLFYEVPKELTLLLTDIHIEQLQRLDSDFEEYFRKTDYRFANEPKGEEQLAWLKSLRFYVGERLK